MKRWTLSMISVLTICGIGLIAPLAMAIDGPLANATVSFGEWKTEPPLDRFPDNSPAAANNHELIPNKVTIKEGGAVNFIISGLHMPTVYDDGTQPEDIDINDLVPSITTAGGIINDSTDRIYRALNAIPLPRDRVEVVNFSKPGTYLVICAFRNHFFNPATQQFEMFGFVRVLSGSNKK